MTEENKKSDKKPADAKRRRFKQELEERERAFAEAKEKRRYEQEPWA